MSERDPRDIVVRPWLDGPLHESVTRAGAPLPGSPPEAGRVAALRPFHMIRKAPS
jgi:hypothetical protein